MGKYSKNTYDIRLTPKLREFVRTDKEVQIAIALEINIDTKTPYQWALYNPERLQSNPAAMKIAKEYYDKAHV